MVDQYTARLAKVEEALNRVMEGLETDSGQKTFIGTDQNLGPETWPPLAEPALSLVRRPGKRWRPVLMALAGEIAGNPGPACALSPLVELIHNGTLIVDDIEDGADERRGEPAAHRVYGTDRAINSGNLLYLLYGPLIDRGPWDDGTKLELYRLTLEALRKLHWGQGLDIEWHNQPDYYPSLEEYETMSRYKTGALARLAARAGHLAGGGRPKTAEALGETAMTMGLGFQIMDDVINLRTGNPGKARGDDFTEGKKSYPVLMLHALTPDSSLLSEIQSLKGLSPRNEASRFSRVIDGLEASGALEKARLRGTELLQSAKTELLNIAPPSEARDLWQGMIDGFLATGV